MARRHARTLENKMTQSRLLVRIVFVGVVLARCAVVAPTPAIAGQRVVVVMMTDAFRFEPSSVRIAVGETVEWRNASHFSHIVTDDPKLGNAAIPDGATPFSSGEIPPGGSYYRMFLRAGSYRYFCIPHEGIGMVGEITVLPK
jgi:plastocyanin